MADASRGWQPGDRVQLMLPDKSDRPHAREVRVSGTVRAVDLPGIPRGVKVDLDQEINGVTDCYASHEELSSLLTDQSPSQRASRELANSVFRNPALRAQFEAMVEETEGREPVADDFEWLTRAADDGRVSLYPLTPHEALRGLLATPPLGDEDA